MEDRQHKSGACLHQEQAAPPGNPLLEQELNEQASRHIVQAGERLSRAEVFLEKLGEEKAQKMCELKEGQFWVDREKLLAQEEIMQEYILRGLMEKLGTGLPGYTG